MNFSAKRFISYGVWLWTIQIVGFFFSCRESFILYPMMQLLRSPFSPSYWLLLNLPAIPQSGKKFFRILFVFWYTTIRTLLSAGHVPTFSENLVFIWHIYRCLATSGTSGPTDDILQLHFNVRTLIGLDATKPPLWTIWTLSAHDTHYVTLSLSLSCPTKNWPLRKKLPNSQAHYVLGENGSLHFSVTPLRTGNGCPGTKMIMDMIVG